MLNISTKKAIKIKMKKNTKINKKGKENRIPIINRAQKVEKEEKDTYNGCLKTIKITKEQQIRRLRADLALRNQEQER